MTYPTRTCGSNCRFARTMLRAACAALFILGLLLTPTAAAEAAKKEFNLPAGEAAVTLKQFIAQSAEQLLYSPDDVAGLRTKPVQGTMTAREALEAMVAGTSLKVVQENDTGALALKGSSSPNGSGAAPSGDRPVMITISAEAPVVLESVEVTGSRIRGLLEGSTAQPVLLIDRNLIERTGAQSIGDVLRYIPQVSSFTLGQGQTQNQRNALINTQTGSVSYAAGATQIAGNAGLVTATIRGAPAGATLLLIDGKRAPKNNQARSGDGFDLNGIPLSAVERIEVLLDGASSIYGADAMGGVINVITKKQYRGTQLQLGYENTFDTDVGLITGSLTQGISVGRVQGFITASWEKSNEMMMRDRDFLASFDRRPYGGTDFRAASMPGGAGRVARSGTVALPGLTSTQAAIPAGTSGVNLTVADYAAAGTIADPYDAALYSQYAASYRRFSVFGKFDFKVNELIELYTSVRLGRNRNYQVTTPVQAAGITVPTGFPGNPFGIPILLYKTFFDAAPERTATNDTNSIVVGASGRLPRDWRYDLSVTRAYSHTQSTGEFGGSITSTSLASAIAAGQTPNLFYDSSRVADPNAAGVIEALTTPTTDEEKYTTWSYALQVDGPVFALPAGDVAVAGGVELREEYVDFPLRQATDTQTARSGRNEVNAYFAEVNVPVFGGSVRYPLLHQLNFSASYRLEDYGEGGNSRNPRAGLAWRPAAWALVRGSYGEGFKVPTLQQRTQPVTVSNSTTTPLPTNLDPLRGNTVNPVYPVTRGGKPDLRPETSENTTFGLVLEVPKVKGLSVSFDWFDNTYNDRIGSLTFNLMALLYPERITRGANLPTDQAGWLGPVIAADLRPINVAYSQTTGYDMGLKYDRRTPWGELMVSLSGTKYLKNVFVPTPGGAPSPTVSTDSLPVQVNGNAFFSRHAWGVGVLTTYRASNRAANDRASTPSAIRWDAQGNYDFAKAAWVRNRAGGWVKVLLADTKLSLTIFNVLNTRPPFDDLFFPDNTVLDSRLRRYALSLRREF